MHKTCAAGATGTDLLVIAWETKGWGQAPRGSHAKKHNSTPWKYTPLWNRWIYNSICWIRREQTSITIVCYILLQTFSSCLLLNIQEQKLQEREAEVSCLCFSNLLVVFQHLVIVKTGVMELFRNAEYENEFNALIILYTLQPNLISINTHIVIFATYTSSSLLSKTDLLVYNCVCVWCYCIMVLILIRSNLTHVGITMKLNSLKIKSCPLHKRSRLLHPKIRCQVSRQYMHTRARTRDQSMQAHDSADGQMHWFPTGPPGARTL